MCVLPRVATVPLLQYAVSSGESGHVHLLFALVAEPARAR